MTMHIPPTFLNLLGQNDGKRLELVGQAFRKEDSQSQQDVFHKAGIVMWQGVLFTYFGKHIQQADNAVKFWHDYLEKAYLSVPTIFSKLPMQSSFGMITRKKLI